MHDSSLASLKVVDPEKLPKSNQVDVDALLNIFAKTTTSYKYLFFLSLLDILKERKFQVRFSISFQELIVEMLAKAWYPHTYFHLSFGSQDKIIQKLEALKLENIEPKIQFTEGKIDKKLLRKTIASQEVTDSVNHLKRYVPFRLIASFLDPELKREKVSQGSGNDLEKAIPAIAERYFHSKKPLYKFDAIQYRDCQSILIHPQWATYIEKYYCLIQNWAIWQWAEYMSKRNPKTHDIFNKLVII